MSAAHLARQTLPPKRRSRGLGPPPDPHVIPLEHNARVTVDEMTYDGVWLVHIAGTTADPTIFPPDRTLPQIAFDFRDLKLADPNVTEADPFARFRELIGDGLTAGLAPRAVSSHPNPPRHLVFVGHSFGGMVSADYLVRTRKDQLQALVPTVERVTLVMICAAHESPLPYYRIRSDAPLVGPLATWLSHHVTHIGTGTRRRLGNVMKAVGQAPPSELWRETWKHTDELRAVWNLPRASTLDHFWSVIECARRYDIGKTIAENPDALWADLLILSAERDTQWPEAMFDSFWDRVMESRCPRARWCHFPGDDHLSVARQPVKYYKEIKDFLNESRGRPR